MPSTTSWPGTTIALGDLRGRPFILAEPGTALRETVMGAAQAAGFSPLPLFEVGDPVTVRFLVRGRAGDQRRAASWLERPGPVVGAADLEAAPRHRLSLLTPAAGSSPAGRLRASACSSSDSRRLRGREPTSVCTGAPPANSMNVGIEMHAVAAAVSWLSSTSTLTIADRHGSRRPRRGSGSSRGTAGTTRR